MQPWIRRMNYIQDWYSTQNEMYAKEAPAYPVDYYSLDLEKSVYDKELMGGSYEKYGVGQLSGMVWKKIQLLPVYYVEQIQPMYNADEKGLTLKDSELSGLVIPSIYGIKPTEWDFIHFSQKFMFDASDFTPIFVMKNLELSTYGSVNYYKVTLKVTDSQTLPLLNQQLSGIYMFLEFTKRIHEIQTASLLLKLQNKHENLSKKLERFFHSIGIYLQVA